MPLIRTRLVVRLIAATATIVAVAVISLLTGSGPFSPDTSRGPAAAGNGAETAVVAIPGARYVPLDFSITAGADPPAGLTESSWQNPFAAELWDAAGCELSDRGLLIPPRAHAVFLRPYQKLSVELHLAAGQNQPAFDVRMLSPEVPCETALRVLPAGIAAVAWSEHGTATLQDRPAAGAANGGPRVLRIAATGNRLMIDVDGRRVFTCPQPAQQSGRAQYLAFVCHDGPLRITRLRIEGE